MYTYIRKYILIILNRGRSLFCKPVTANVWNVKRRIPESESLECGA